MRVSTKAAIVSLGRGLNTLALLGLSMVLSRALPAEEYGTYRQVWLVFYTMTPFLTVGIPASIMYFIPRLDRPEQKGFVAQTIMLLTLLASLMSGGIYLGAGWLSELWTNPLLTTPLRIFSLYALLTVPMIFIDLLLIALDRPLISALFSTASALTMVIFVVVSVVLGRSLEVVFASLGAFALVRTLVVLLYLGWFFRGTEFRWDRSLLPDQIGYSIPLGMASMAGTIGKQLDKLIVSTFFVAHVYAIYANGAMEIPLISVITGSIMTVLIPEFVRLNGSEERGRILTLWYSATRKVALLFFPLACFLFLFASEFMVFLYSETYLASASPFRVYLLLLPLRIAQYGAILQALGRTRVILGGTLLGVGLNAGLSFLLIQRLGLLGPPLAMVIGTYVNVLVYLVVIGRELSVGLAGTMPWAKLGRIGLLAALSGVALYPLTHVGLDPLPKLVLGALGYGAIYVGLAFLTHTATVQDLELVGRISAGF